jgi:precorrin-8X/cobalt-precorrin-8 methylmutase
MNRASPAAAGYLRDPAAIYRQSFAAIRAEADLSRFVAEEAAIAIRIVHACGMPEVARDLVFAGGVAAAGRTALVAGAPILVDGRMVAAGIVAARLPAANVVLCMLDDPGVAEDAARRGSTRSAAAVDRWRPYLAGAVVAIGNAPTALFRLLELLADGAPRPAAILAFPVGFVGAAEAKAALVAADAGLPYAMLPGRRGGSAMAAAAVNAMARDGI